MCFALFVLPTLDISPSDEGNVRILLLPLLVPITDIPHLFLPVLHFPFPLSRNFSLQTAERNSKKKKQLVSLSLLFKRHRPSDSLCALPLSPILALAAPLNVNRCLTSCITQVSRAVMESTAQLGWVTVVLVNNIHCASCVSFVQDVLAGFGNAVHSVEASILSHEVRIHHAKSLSTSDICLALSSAAFEIHGAVTVDNFGVRVQELDLTKDPDGWLEAATDRWRPLAQPSTTSRISRLELPERNRRKMHMENCAACREELSSREKAARPLSSRRVPLSIGVDEIGSRQIQWGRSYSEEQGQDASGHLGSAVTGGVKEEPRVDAVELSARGNVQVHRVALSIGGMTCASCAASITHALNALDFVQDVNVNLITNSATVAFIGAKKLSEKIVESIEDVGFDASVADDLYSFPSATTSNTPQGKLDELRFRAIFNIGGMTCASCTSSIEESLRQLPFVDTANVTLLTNSAAVTFMNEDNAGSIIRTVEDLGYNCEIQSCNPVKRTSEVAVNFNGARQRTIRLRIEGMFCKHCPKNIVNAISSKFPSLVQIEKLPSLEDSIMTVAYTPSPPDFTIRDVIHTINSLNESFNTKIYHPPSIEQQSQAMQVHEQRRLLRRLLLSFVAAVPTFLIGVVWMSLVSSSNKTRMFFEKSLWSGSVSRAEWALFVLASPVMFLAADMFHIRAIKEIRALWRKSSRVPILRRFYRFGSMNLLISAGTSVAYFSSLALLIMAATSSKYSSSHSATYFDSVVFLTFFILIGRFVEAYSKSKTGSAVALLGKLRPREAILVNNKLVLETASGDSNDTTEKSAMKCNTKVVDADLLEVGDVVLVPHGSSPPADGVIIAGSTSFNESSLTGESRTVAKSQDDQVFAGAVNVGDPISVRVLQIGGTSMLDQIISVIREGQTRRAPVERVVDLVTGYFVPIITALAILTFLIWFSLGQSGVLSPIYVDQQKGGWAFWSLEFAIAVFVVACPCGIGLAAPTALFVGGGLAANNGILVRGGGEAFQEASNIDIVVFDKTGTLTEGGNLKVTDHEMLVDGVEAEIAWPITKTLEENSSHPIARAVLEFASCQPSYPVQATAIKEIPGLGLRAAFTVTDPVSKETVTYEAALGSESLISSLEPRPEPLNYFTTNTLSLWKSQSKSVALLALRRLPSPPSPSSHEWTLTTLFAISDPIRASALPTISALHARNIPVYMLTGDNPTTAAAVASSLSIQQSNVFAGVLPTEKAAKIQYLQAHGPRRSRRSFLSRFRRSRSDHQDALKPAIVAFIGDGINDAPALSTASVSICVASASDIALTSSSFVLLSSSLESITTLLDLSERVFRRVRFNFAWAVAYNACLVPVAAGVLFKVGGREMGWRLGPVWGSAAMALSSCSVVISSLALRWRAGSKSHVGSKKDVGGEGSNQGADV